MEEEYNEFDNELDNDSDNAPGYEPECLALSESDEVDCEFTIRHGSWWCLTHNCYA